MKAIYINLDPYLAAFAAWLAGGKVGMKPDFRPLPLAVTVPLGQEVAVLMPDTSSTGEGEAQAATVNGTTVYYTAYLDSPSVVESKKQLAFSAYAPTAKYCAAAVSGESVTVTVLIGAESDAADGVEFPVTILVRREQASGPVDLVDFTPPAAAPSAADIKSALVAAGEGALAGVSLDQTVYWFDGSEAPVNLILSDSNTHSLGASDPVS